MSYPRDMVCRDRQAGAVTAGDNGNFVAAAALEILLIAISRSAPEYMGLPRSDAARTVDFRYIGTDLQE